MCTEVFLARNTLGSLHGPFVGLLVGANGCVPMCACECACVWRGGVCASVCAAAKSNTEALDKTIALQRVLVEVLRRGGAQVRALSLALRVCIPLQEFWVW